MTRPMPAGRPQPAFPPSGGLPPDAWATRALEVHQLGAETAANLNCEDDQASGRQELRVGGLALASPRINRGLAGDAVGPRACRAIPRHRAHEGVSTATWAPCHNGSPLARTSMRRESASGTSMFMSRNKTLVATRAPPSRQILAVARSNGATRGPRTLATGQAARCWKHRHSGNAWECAAAGALNAATGQRACIQKACGVQAR